MAIPLFNEDVMNVSGLSDLPNAEDRLTSEQLKLVFDKAGSDIKNYINGTLIPNINGSSAKSFTAIFPGGASMFEFYSPNYGINANSIVFCQPERGESMQLWNSCDIQCTGVSENKLTFTAATEPTAGVTIKVLVMN